MINIKELAVGTHVIVGNHRRRVISLDLLNGAVCATGYMTDDDGRKHPIATQLECIAPIPVTEALLGEIGFEKHGMWERNVDGHIIYIYGRQGRWCVSTFTGDSDQNTCYFRFLHELERFVDLTLGIALIDDEVIAPDATAENDAVAAMSPEARRDAFIARLGALLSEFDATMSDSDDYRLFASIDNSTDNPIDISWDMNGDNAYRLDADSVMDFEMD